MILHHELLGAPDAPALILGGSLGTTLRMWDGQLALAVDHRLVRFDHRGHGRSPAPPGPYEIADLGRDLLAVMDALELERASFAGLSLGAMIGMWLGAHAPERIERLVLVCTAAHMPPASAWQERAASVRAAGSTEPIADAVVQRWLTPAFSRAHPEVRTRLRGMLVSSDPDGYAACCGAIERMDLRESLSSIRAPTLVISGAERPGHPAGEPGADRRRDPAGAVRGRRAGRARRGGRAARDHQRADLRAPRVGATPLRLAQLPWPRTCSSGRTSLFARQSLPERNQVGHMSRRTRLGLAAALGLAGLSAVSGQAVAPAAIRQTSGAATAVAVPVPAKYQSLYDQLSTHLNAFSSAVAAMPATSATPHGGTPTAGVELLAANGNRLTALLRPGAMTLIDASLDRFRALGMGGVTLGIKLPMLLSTFSPDAARYANFYATVANHIRARKMAVSVELGALFCGTVYANCTNPFAGSLQKFVSEQAAQARIVIKRVHPNYLTLFAEPDTEAELTGLKTLDTPAGAARAVGDILAKIGPRGRTQVGAGSPTWLSPSFAKAIAAKRIDYLDTHIYPVGYQEGANATAIAAIAQRAHKPVVADEVWLYKSADPGAGGGVATADQIFRQDTFSFWEPLDARFLSTAAKWAHKAGAEYVSAFWSWQFFTYLEWTPALDADSYPQLNSAFGQTVTGAVANGATTPLGKLWGRDLRRALPH